MATPTDQFRLKLAPSTAYNFTVNWGDGTSEVYNQTTSSTEDLAGLTHTYSTPGVYDLTITENALSGFQRIYFNGTNNTSLSNDDVKVTDIVQWGNPSWSSMSDAFEGCTNLSAVATDNNSLSGVSDFASAWFRCGGLKSFPLIDTSNATNFYATWAQCPNLASFPLINTSKGTMFDNAWQNCSSLSSFPLIDTSNGTSFNNTWQNCSSLSSFPLIDTSKGTDFFNTWGGCQTLSSFPLINTSNGTSFGSTWKNCARLKSFPLIDTSNGTNFGSTWSGCAALSSFPLINTSNGTIFGSTWNYCISLSSFPLIDTSKGTNFSNAWENCISLNSFPLIDTSNGTNFFRAWRNCTSLSSFPLINTLSATNLSEVWWFCTSLKSFPLIDTSNATNFYGTWQNCSSLSSFPLIDTSKGTNFGGTWGGCAALRSFPLINTLSATDMTGTWYDCTSLSSFPLINTSKVTNFNGTWRNCTSLSSTDFPILNMSKMLNGSLCFEGVKLTTNSYSTLLSSICATNTNSMIVFHGGNSLYNSTFGLSARNHLVNVKGWTITDGGLAAPTYSLSRSAASVNEGGSVTFTMTTTDVIDGTTVPYTITGVSTSDIGGAPLTGNFTINNNTSTATFNISADSSIYEGPETMTMTSGGKTASVTINDTSVQPQGYDFWTGITSDSTGNNLIVTGPLSAIGSPIYMYNSSNGGSTWTKKTLGIPSSNLRSIKPNGVLADTTNNKLAFAGEDYIYTSTDAGSNWIAQTGAGLRKWRGFVMDSTGQTLVGYAYPAANDGLYQTVIAKSINGGANWTTNTGNYVAYGYGYGIVRSTPNLSTIMTIGTHPTIPTNQSVFYKSLDQGLTSTTFEGPSALNSEYELINFDFDSSGNTILVVQYKPGAGGTAYLSLWKTSNQGSTWIELPFSLTTVRPITEAVYGLLIPVVSPGGSFFAVINNADGYIYTSSDGGTTWIKRTSAGSRQWTQLKLNSNGTKIVASSTSERGGLIYTSADSGSTWTERYVY